MASNGPTEIRTSTHHVYGRGAALCVETDTTRKGVATLAVEGADALGPRQYDWENKTRLQLTPNELPIALCVFLGLLPECEFHSHGSAKNKSLALRRQRDKPDQLVFVRVCEGGRKTKAVPVSNADCYHIEALMMCQLRAQHPFLDGTMLMAMLRSIAVPRERSRAAD